MLAVDEYRRKVSVAATAALRSLTAPPAAAQIAELWRHVEDWRRRGVEMVVTEQDDHFTAIAAPDANVGAPALPEPLTLDLSRTPRLLAVYIGRMSQFKEVRRAPIVVQSLRTRVVARVQPPPPPQSVTRVNPK